MAQIINNFRSIDSGTLKPFNFKSTNLSVAWKLWYKQFKIFLLAGDLNETNDIRKNSLLLHHMGSEVFEIFDSFDVDEEKISHKDLVKKFENYFVPKVNIIMERYNFFTRRQNPTETIDEYITVLKNLSKTCDFNEIKEDLIRDLFICGLNHKYSYIREKLLSEGDKKLDKIIEMAKVLETTKEQSKEFSEEGRKSFIGQLRNNHPKMQLHQFNSQSKSKSGYNLTKPSQHGQQYKKGQIGQSSDKKICNRCGQQHYNNKCPAINATCFKCGRKNHYSKMCRGKIKTVNNIENSSEEEEQLFLGMITDNKINNKSWYVNIKINNFTTKLQIDTGAQCNIMSITEFKKLKLDEKLISKTKSSVFTFSGESLSVLGKIKIDCKFNNNTFKL